MICSQQPAVTTVEFGSSHSLHSAAMVTINVSLNLVPAQTAPALSPPAQTPPTAPTAPVDTTDAEAAGTRTLEQELEDRAAEIAILKARMTTLEKEFKDKASTEWEAVLYRH